MSLVFHCNHCGEAMQESDPTNIAFHCNLCGSTMHEGDPIIILNVTGPTATDGPRRFSDYCPRCWDTVSRIVETVEESLLSDPRRWSKTESRQPESPS
jgi:ribosomal protein L44E